MKTITFFQNEIKEDMKSYWRKLSNEVVELKKELDIKEKNHFRD